MGKTRKDIQCLDVEMNTGYTLSGKKISELTKHILNKFAEEHLSRDEAIEVLKKTESVLGEVAIVQKLD